MSICRRWVGVFDSTPYGVTTLGGVPPSRPANPTVLLILVAAVWVVASRVVPGHWILTLLVAAVAVNVLLWLHHRWVRRRTARRLDPTRPYSNDVETD